MTILVLLLHPALSDLETTSGSYDSFGFSSPCPKGTVAVQKPEGIKCMAESRKRSSSSWRQTGTGNLIER